MNIQFAPATVRAHEAGFPTGLVLSPMDLSCKEVTERGSGDPRYSRPGGRRYMALAVRVVPCYRAFAPKFVPEQDRYSSDFICFSGTTEVVPWYKARGLGDFSQPV